MPRILLLVLILLSLEVWGQQSGSISGTILNAGSKKPLPFATVTVFSAEDTAMVTYRLSNENGKFQVPGIPLNRNMRVLITYSGFAVYRKNFILSAQNSTLSFDTISLAATTKDLEEIIVTAERPPVIYKNDTIEFNASSFKTLPTALVEDLLKKLPGVSVDAQGNITVNGRPVNRIYVDGKEFFGGDTRIATRNLPANIIEKVQVLDDPDDLAMNPDAPVGTLGRIVNLKLKRSVRKQLFGKATAGYGTNDRYEASAILNQFRDTLQISVLGFSNNVNRAAFGYNDLRTLGGFKRSGTSNVSVSSNGGIAINNISFGGTGDGIQQSGGGGLNISNDLKNGTGLNFQYFYGQTNNEVDERSNQYQYFQDTVLTTRTVASRNKEVFSHRFGTTLKWNKKGGSRYEFRPVVILSKQNSDARTRISNATNFSGEVNQTINEEDLEGKERSYGHNFLLFKNFKKKGRVLNLNQAVYVNRLDMDRFNSALDSFFIKSPPDGNITRQLRDRENGNLNLTLSGNYTEPLSKSLSLRFTEHYNYSNGRDELITRDYDPVSGRFDQLNPGASSNLKRQVSFNNSAVGINYKYKKLSLTGSANYLRYDITDRFGAVQKRSYQQYNFLQPGLALNWKEFNLNYNVSVTPPSLYDLQPVVDNSNPLFITIGNPLLKPTVNRAVSFNYFKYAPAKLLSTNLYLSAGFKDDAVIRRRFINADKVQTSMPFNKDGLYEIVSLVSLNKQLNFSKTFMLSIQGSFSFIKEQGFVYVNEETSDANSTELYPTVQLRSNWSDRIEFVISANQTARKTAYPNAFFPDLKTRIFRSYEEIIIRWPKNFIIETNLTYQFNSVASSGRSQKAAILNSAITYLFLEGNKGQLKLYAFDLLEQNATLSKFIAENYVVERNVELLTRYFMLSFHYDLRGFNKNKAGGRERLLLF